MRVTKSILLVLCVFFLLCSVQPAFCWSNGGYSDNPAQPDYGTHDWIAQHALDYLPAQEKQYITDNLNTYLYGTELPDNSGAPDGIGDTTKHHVYFAASGAVTDAASAQRANAEYNLALNYLKAGDFYNASKTAGIMTHYIADMAVFGHVMGASTPWGAETHHSDYEDYVTAASRTGSYSGSFSTYLSYDGSLVSLSAYDAAINIAYDTTFGGSNHLTCVWMDDNYNWSNSTFSGRCGQSLNLAVNTVADVLHTLYLDAQPSPTPTPIPEFPTATLLSLVMLTILVSAIAYRQNAKIKQLQLRFNVCRFSFDAVVHLVEGVLLEHGAVGTQTACGFRLLRRFASCAEHVAG